MSKDADAELEEWASSFEPPNQDTEVDEILQEFFFGLVGPPGIAADSPHILKAKTALNQYYKSILLEELGEFEVEPDKKARNADMRREGRNQLRAEVRQRLESRLGE